MEQNVLGTLGQCWTWHEKDIRIAEGSSQLCSLSQRAGNIIALLSSPELWLWKSNSINTHSAHITGISSFFFWYVESLSLPGTSKTLHLHSTQWVIRALESYSSLTPKPRLFWRSRIEAECLTSVEGATSHISGSPGSPLWVRRVWLSA